MCGRYELHAQPAAIALAFGLGYAPEIHSRYNIAPTQNVPIVRVNAAGERELIQVRWGLVPRWAKDPSIGAKMINARGESAATKQSVNTAFRRHRCLLPADGFYEWRANREGPKQPMRIGMRDGEVFGMAGLYERWLSPAGEPLDTCTIVTTEANELLRPLHDRMPLIVPPSAYARWLDPSEPDAESLVAAYPASLMIYWPVSTRVNNVRNDGASCIEPLTSEEVDVASAPAPEPVEEIDEPTQTQLF